MMRPSPALQGCHRGREERWAEGEKAEEDVVLCLAQSAEDAVPASVRPGPPLPLQPYGELELPSSGIHTAFVCLFPSSSSSPRQLAEHESCHSLASLMKNWLVRVVGYAGSENGVTANAKTMRMIAMTKWSVERVDFVCISRVRVP